MRIKKTVLCLLTVLVGAGCSSPPRSAPVDSDHATIAAADENFFAVIGSNIATTRLDAINGVPTGSWRYNRGSGPSKPGPVALLLRFWGENKLKGPAETFACVRFQAKARKSYVVSTISTGKNYVVSIAETSSTPPTPVASYNVEYSEDARKPGCA